MTTLAKTPLLIVDDDRAIRTLLATVARRAGFAVDVAKDGVEALEMLAVKKYEIAIVDLMMPRVSGYELVQRISQMPARPTVLVATAMSNSDVQSLDDSMVRRVIRKPFDIAALTTALVETAKEIAERRALAGETFNTAPAEAATIRVAATPDVVIEVTEPVVSTQADDAGNPPATRTK